MSGPLDRCCKIFLNQRDFVRYLQLYTSCNSFISSLILLSLSLHFPPVPFFAYPLYAKDSKEIDWRLSVTFRLNSEFHGQGNSHRRFTSFLDSLLVIELLVFPFPFKCRTVQSGSVIRREKKFLAISVLLRNFCFAIKRRKKILDLFKALQHGVFVRRKASRLLVSQGVITP